MFFVFHISPTKLLLFLETTKLFRNIIQKSRYFFGIGLSLRTFHRCPQKEQARKGN